MMGWIESKFIGNGKIIDQDLPARWRIPVRKQFDIVDQRGLPAPGRPHDTDHLSRFQFQSLNGFFYPVFPISTANGDF